MSKRNIITPFGTVVAAYTDRPDKPYEDGAPELYKVRLSVDEKEVEAFKKRIMDIVKEEGHSFDAKVKKPKIGVSVSEEGVVTILGSSKYKPTIYDAKKNQLDNPRIGKGTVARLFCNLNMHKKGVGLQLIQVQIKKLVEWESSSPKGAAFDETDGYEAPEGSAFDDEDGEPGGGGDALDI